MASKESKRKVFLGAYQIYPETGESNLEDFIKSLRIQEENFRKIYKDVEIVNIYLDTNWDSSDSFYLRGFRLETDEEYKIRMKAFKDEQLKNKKLEKEKQAKKEEEEKKLYEKLRVKYEK